jgi:acyl CoA:acetate/3-ketoacid CoA transferase beta subunit
MSERPRSSERGPSGPAEGQERGAISGDPTTTSGSSGPVTGVHVTRAEVCAVAVAECFRGDGEILANPIGTIPMIGGRLARATFEPDLCMTDGEAALIANDQVTVAPADRVYEYWNPYRSMFDWVWSGRRHVMMGATQVDRFGNQNLAAIGDYARPKVQLLGYRGAPGNTINDTTSYWVPNHGPKVLVPAVDTVTGIGWDRAAALGEGGRFVEIRRVVTNLAVLDFETPDHTMRLRSVHPGVTVDEVVAATGFELVVPSEVPVSRAPTATELELIREVIDPDATREREVPDPD